MKIAALCVILFFMGASVHASINLILQDDYEGITAGRSSGVTYVQGRGGKAVVMDSASDTVEYAAEEFAVRSGRIEFDLKLIQPLTGDHKAWCLLSDVGSGSPQPGNVLIQWRENIGKLEYGIYDGKAYQWCISRRSEWQADRWYHLVFAYGAEGMRLEIDGRVEAQNAYTGGLASTPKRLGFDDAVFDSPTVAIDNLFTYRVNTDFLAVTPENISRSTDGTLDKCTITYGLAETGIVLMEVVNKKGKVLLPLIDDQIKHAGDYTLLWEPQKLSDGEYTIRLIRDSASAVKGLKAQVKVSTVQPNPNP